MCIPFWRIGQGIQHIALRVADLNEFVERANRSGRGLSFLRIPRSYYGILKRADLLQVGLSEAIVTKVLHELQRTELMTVGGVVRLDISDEEIISCLSSTEFPGSVLPMLIDTIKKSRYINIYKLLGDCLTEETYLRLARNQVLVDVEGDGLLLQIFTRSILQDTVTHEAPFLEYIQRSCISKLSASGRHLMKPGCGGFGLRNILALFLAVEMARALDELEHAEDLRTKQKAQSVIDTLTEQLNAWDPILARVSRANSKEAQARDAMSHVSDIHDKLRLEILLKKCTKKKADAEAELLELSSHYATLLREIRQSYIPC